MKKNFFIHLIHFSRFSLLHSTLACDCEEEPAIKLNEFVSRVTIT